MTSQFGAPNLNQSSSHAFPKFLPSCRKHKVLTEWKPLQMYVLTTNIKLISTLGNTQSPFTAAEKTKTTTEFTWAGSTFLSSLICVLTSKPLPRLLVAILSPARAQEKESFVIHSRARKRSCCSNRTEIKWKGDSCMLPSLLDKWHQQFSKAELLQICIEVWYSEDQNQRDDWQKYAALFAFPWQTNI